MSVQSEINRIVSAKSDISTAITNKGVTVPSGTKLDGMAALIGSIDSGGANLQTKSVMYNTNGTATITPDEGYDGLSYVDVKVDVSSGCRGLIDGLVLDGITASLCLKDISVEYCEFTNGDYYFLNNGSNITFTGCYFDGSNIYCAQEIYDAIVNGDSNYYSSAHFTIGSL